MTGSIIFAAIVLAIVVVLELSNRRHTDPTRRLTGSWIRNDRDLDRTKRDLTVAAQSDRFQPSATVHHFPRVLTHHAA
jgi:hypothetical protein